MINTYWYDFRKLSRVIKTIVLGPKKGCLNTILPLLQSMIWRGMKGYSIISSWWIFPWRSWGCSGRPPTPSARAFRWLCPCCGCNPPESWRFLLGFPSKGRSRTSYRFSAYRRWYLSFDLFELLFLLATVFGDLLLGNLPRLLQLALST